MTDEHGASPQGETPESDPTEAGQFAAAEQPTSIMPQGNRDGSEPNVWGTPAPAQPLPWVDTPGLPGTPGYSATQPAQGSAPLWNTPGMPGYPATQPAQGSAPLSWADPSGQPGTPGYPATQTAQGSAPLWNTPGTVPAQPGYPPVGAYPPNYAQPGYSQALYQQQSISQPLQPGQGAPYAPPRKRRAWLWITLIVLALFLLGGGTALAIVITQRPTNTPTQALQQFCDGYTALDAQKVYDSLSSASKAHTSLADLQNTFAQLKSFSDMVKITACKVGNVHENGSTATGTVTLTDTATFMGTSVSATVTMSMGLVLENNTWKVDTTKTNSQFALPTPTIQFGFPTPTASGS